MIFINMDNRKIGKKIKKARVETGMSQGDLAEKIGVTWEMVSRYENGRSSAHKHLDTISLIFDKDISYFVGGNGLYESRDLDKLKSVIQDSELSYLSSSNSPHKAPIYDSHSDFIENEDSERIFYDIPSWVTSKYSKIYVFRMRYINSNDVEFSDGDIAIFTKSDLDAVDNYCLFNQNNKLLIEKYSNKTKGEFIGRLIYIERRFVN